MNTVYLSIYLYCLQLFYWILILNLIWLSKIFLVFQLFLFHIPWYHFIDAISSHISLRILIKEFSFCCCFLLFLVLSFSFRFLSFFYGGGNLWVFLAVPHGMWDLSSLARDRTPCPLHWKHGVLTSGPQGKSPDSFLFCLLLGLSPRSWYPWLSSHI